MEKFWCIVTWGNELVDVLECGSWSAAKAARDEIWPELRERVFNVELFDPLGVRLWSSDEAECNACVPLADGRYEFVEAQGSSPDVNERFRKVGAVAPLLALWGVAGGAPYDREANPVSTRMKRQKAARWRAEGRGL